MSKKVTATEAKATILALLDEVSTGDEIEISKHGRTVARLVPAHGARTLEGSLVGSASTVAKDADLFTTGIPWNVESR